MVEIGSPEIQDFLQRLGARYPGTGSLYLLGGSALCLLGSTRRTLDIDYTLEASAEEVEQLQATIEALAMELKLGLEAVPSNRSNQHTGEPTQCQNARASRKALLIRYNVATCNLL